MPLTLFRDTHYNPNCRLLPFLLVSLLIAICGFAAVWRFDAHKAVPFYFWMWVAWGTWFLVSAIWLRLRVLWLLVALPFLLFWILPVMMMGCAYGPYACV
jgi:hypothetical protein